MVVQSSPQLTPSVNITSPRSPPRSYFDRSPSRSPERVDNTPFGKVRELISQHSSSASSRPPSPRAKSADRVETLSAHPAGLGIHEAAKLLTKPPPVNRSEKPRIPAKPTGFVVPASALTPDTRRPSVEARVSPFSTPPSSDESPPQAQSPSSGLAQGVTHAMQPLVIPRRGSNQQDRANAVPRPQHRDVDPRSMGLSTAAKPVVERRDPRSIGFSSFPLIEQRSPSRDSSIPARANTVNERPVTRDARDSAFSPVKPSPRHVSESIRPTPPRASPPHKNLPITASRDPRQLGFNAKVASVAIEEEPRPGLPPRRTVAGAPLRPSDALKHTMIRQVNTPAPQNIIDRSTKPGSVKRDVPSSVPATSDIHFPPPPKRNTFPEADVTTAPQSLQMIPGRNAHAATDPVKGSTHPTNRDDSDEAEDVNQEPNSYRTEYPDATQTNRRPPFFHTGQREINTKSDCRVFDICGRFLCIGGYVTRVFDMTTGEAIMGLNHGETTKVISVAFKPATELENEGKRLWLGTNTGDIIEVDIATHSTIHTNLSHNRREVVRILRHRKDLWTLDDDGKLFVWRADESGVPNLKYSRISHKVQKGHAFSMVVGDKLWLATGKELRVYKPGNESSFAALTSPLAQHNGGDITSGAYSDEHGGRVYFGHTDGRVTIYSTKDHSCVGSVKASEYKINGLAFVGGRLWAAYKTGKVYVYNTSVTPWKVSKDWRAHDGPAAGMVLDPSSFWTMGRLQVVTAGHDNTVRIWDAMLEEDCMESAMQEKDFEYCSFRELRAAVITWNAGAVIPLSLKDDFLEFIRDAIDADDPPEIVAFGFQEVVDLEDRAVTAKSILGFGKKKDPVKTEQHQSRVYREWRDYLARALGKVTNARYVEIQTLNLVGLFQCVFVRQDERDNIRNLSATNVKCGMGGRLGNKGALITRFVLDDSSLCFINCHLAAGQSHTSHRNNDVAVILESENLPSERNPDVRSSLYVGGGDGTQILDHEICILNGDLNYRIDAIPRDTVIRMVKGNELSKLLDRDQIMVSRRRVPGFRLGPFIEMPISFAPTYKYDVGSDDYDSSEKKRAPAWCDRLLYRGPGKIKQLDYRRHEIRYSDHRPVSGVFRIRVKTIDQTRRKKVMEKCGDEFSDVKRRIAEQVSVYYLVNSLGIAEKEARKLIASG